MRKMGMARRKVIKIQDAEVSEPAAPPEKTEDGVDFDLGNVLVEKGPRAR